MLDYYLRVLFFFCRTPPSSPEFVYLGRELLLYHPTDRFSVGSPEQDPLTNMLRRSVERLGPDALETQVCAMCF